MPIVSNPTAGDVHVNRPLTNFSQKYLQDAAQFVAGRAIPNLPVAKQSDLYYEFAREDFYRDEAEERADGAESAGGGFALSTEPYFARVYAFHKDVTDRQRANQDAPVALDRSATQFVTHKLLIRRERLMAGAFLTAGSSPWFNGTTAAVAAGQAVDWRGFSGGAAVTDPIQDVRDAMDDIEATTGYRPNKMLMGRRAWSILQDNDEILSRITGGSTAQNAAMVRRALVAQLFEVDQINVMGGVFNSAIRGATENTDFINSGEVLLYYAPDSLGLEEPSAMARFSWTGLMGNTADGMRIRRFRKEGRQADRIEGEMSFQFKVTGAELGHLFTVQTVDA